MSKKKIISDYKKKIKQINSLNEHYYKFSKPKVDDITYDQLKKTILDLEKKFDFLIHKKSPSKVVGYKPSKNFKKVTHKVPMLALGNAFSDND